MKTLVQTKENINIKEKVIKDKTKVRVDKSRALQIFDELMAPGAKQNKVVQKYIDENIDFDWLIRLIPIEKLKTSYPVEAGSPLNGNNTFLNKIVGLHLKDLVRTLSVESMDYLARNSDCGRHHTLYLYFYITGFWKNRQCGLIFSSQTIDYLLDNTSFYIDEPSEFLKKINLKTRFSYSLLALCFRGLIGKIDVYTQNNKLYQNYLNAEQIERIVNNTAPSVVQKSQYSIAGSLVGLKLCDRLNILSQKTLLKLVNDFCLQTQNDKLEFMENAICLLNEVKTDKPWEAQSRREFLILFESVHKFDWRDVVLQSEPTGPFLRNNRNGMFTRRVLKEMIYDRGLGKREAYRSEFIKQELGRIVLEEHDRMMEILEQKTLIEMAVGLGIELGRGLDRGIKIEKNKNIQVDRANGNRAKTVIKI